MMRYAFALAGLLVLGAPVGVQAQAGQQRGAAVSPADTAVVELVLRREVFAYPTFERRDPFMPLLSLDTGPRFDQMRLTGIAFDNADPGNSIAVIAAEVGRTTAAPQAAVGAERVAPTGQVRRLKAGERWGNVRIVRVEADRVVVDVNNFGVVESRVMLLYTRSQGGS
jgi:hypothetical protein